MTIILTNIFSFGQTFVGTSTDRMKAYNCTIHINKDSTVYFIYNTDKNGVYADYVGRIKKIDDTLFHISATMRIGQFYMKSFRKDTIYIQLDSTIARTLDKIQVEYSDKQTRKQLKGYDRLGHSIELLKIPIDKNLFNEKKGTDFIEISVNRKHLLIDKFLSFRIPFGSAASFTKGQKEDFFVIIKNGQLYTTTNPPLQTGHFKLRIKKGN